MNEVKSSCGINAPEASPRAVEIDCANSRRHLERYISAAFIMIRWNLALSVFKASSG